MKLISDEKLVQAKYLRGRGFTLSADDMDRRIATAQLSADEKEHKKVVEEIVADIKSRLQPEKDYYIISRVNTLEIENKYLT